MKLPTKIIEGKAYQYRIIIMLQTLECHLQLLRTEESDHWVAFKNHDDCKAFLEAA